MNRPLHSRHAHLPTVAATAATLILLAGCTPSERYHATNTQTIAPVTHEVATTGDTTTPPVVFTTEAEPTQFDPVFTNVSTSGTFPTTAPTALSADTRNISVFGDVTPEMTPTRSFNSSGIDGEENLTRVTYSPVGGDYDPDVSPDGQTMVFSSTQHHPTADIYLKRVGGRSVTQLTADPAHDVMPTFSPDGRRIAFASDRAGNWDIYVISLAGGQPMQVTTDSSQELHASWSPDGTQLVYSRLSTQSGRWELWVADLEDTGTHQFLCYGLFPDWSPNPNRPQIAFQRARERDSRLFGVWTVNYSNGEATNPTEIAASTNAALINPTWSPTASHLVFAAVVEPFGDAPAGNEVADLWMVDFTGLHRVNLTDGQFTCLMPEWSTDGQIFFVCNREGVDNIWSIGPERGLLASAPNTYDFNVMTATATPTATTPTTTTPPTTDTSPDTATAAAPTEILGEVPGE
jgi:TolB protein